PASTPAAIQPPVTKPPATPLPAKPKPGEVSLDIAVKDESAWFFVEVDGQVVYEGIASNYKERVTGKQIRLGSSRPDLLLISVNGEQTKPFGTAAEANQDKEELFVPKP
ncbi:MAG: hypothetical protein HC771_22505, partial [Synechococcales cyanobacterium CRU_2_2]|nr:hypothetical protein [Synechococcales cyanobacterium CRU_2_2]